MSFIVIVRMSVYVFLIPQLSAADSTTTQGAVLSSHITACLGFQL